MNKNAFRIEKDILNDLQWLQLNDIAIPANENGLKWIKFDSDFQKYGFILTFVNPYFWKSESNLIHFNPVSFAGIEISFKYCNVIHRNAILPQYHPNDVVIWYIALKYFNIV